LVSWGVEETNNSLFIEHSGSSRYVGLVSPARESGEMRED
jgi:hypothetical protein